MEKFFQNDKKNAASSSSQNGVASSDAKQAPKEKSAEKTQLTNKASDKVASANRYGTFDQPDKEQPVDSSNKLEEVEGGDSLKNKCSIQ